MRAFAPPGAGRDIVPAWMVADSSVFSKTEHQRTERVEAEIRRRAHQDKPKGGGKGDKGKNDKKGKDH